MKRLRLLLALSTFIILMFNHLGCISYANGDVNYVGRINKFAYIKGMLSYDGYGYLEGIEIPNKMDVTHKIKFVDINSGKQILTYSLNHYYSEAVTKDPKHGNGQYNYDWAKFSGGFNLEQLPIGSYYIKVYINANDNKYEQIIPFHSSIDSFSIRIANKNYNFSKVKKNGINTFQLTVTNITDQENNHIKRISNLYGTNNGLFIDGYSYVKYTNIAHKSDIIQKLKFVNTTTGKQVSTYQLPNYYSTAASKDPNHGADIYNYDWAKFKGTVMINNLPLGEYYMKIYTNAKGQKFDDYINVHSNIQDFSYQEGDKEFTFNNIKINGIQTLKVTVVSKPRTKHVVIDPGHGGKDSGAIGGGFYEKDLNLDIARATAEYLQSKNVKVTMTRNEDKTMELKDRSSFVNSINPDLTVSIHNDANITGAKGAHVIYSLHDRNGGPTKTLAQNILDSIIKNTGQIANNRGIWYREYPGNPNADYYHIVREINTPAVIVECAFMNSTNITSLHDEYIDITEEDSKGIIENQENLNENIDLEESDSSNDEIMTVAVDTPDKRKLMGIAIAKGILKTLGIND